MTIFDEQLQIFKIRETLVTRALRDYMKLDKTNVTITRGEGTWVTPTIDLSFWNADNTRGVLTLDYSEYLRLFLNTAMMASGYQPALARIGDCIQVNTDSDITKMSTMLSVEATVTNRTTFMRKIADWSGAGWQYGDSYSIDYKSVLGY